MKLAKFAPMIIKKLPEKRGCTRILPAEKEWFNILTLVLSILFFMLQSIPLYRRTIFNLVQRVYFNLPILASTSILTSFLKLTLGFHFKTLLAFEGSAINGPVSVGLINTGST